MRGSVPEPRRPDYVCPVSASDTWTWDDVYPADLGAEITAFHIHSLHADGTWGDYSQLYGFTVLVR